MSPALVDTDTLSALMRGNPKVQAHARAYLTEHGRFTMSLITRYEVLRGLKAKNANAQESAFEKLCAKSVVLPLEDTTIVRAAGLYADLHRRGMLIGDADILIAATALQHELVLLTNNTVHFNRIAGLQFQNWLAGPLV